MWYGKADAVFEDRMGPRAKEHRQPLVAGKAKEIDTPLESP